MTIKTKETEYLTTKDVALITNHSQKTVTRWLEKGILKGYRIGSNGHWRIMPKDLRLFMIKHEIPAPDPENFPSKLRELILNCEASQTCWEFFQTKGEDIKKHTSKGCTNCLVYKVRALNCYALKEEVDHKKIFCEYDCSVCSYYIYLKDNGYLGE
ncbi:MAG: helix-turn-helix domain-containing protein [Deltaproteobacteria bacterium]|nr:helix-turn-helix domain-containing protein [Deltaproteobacteria bacterium]